MKKLRVLFAALGAAFVMGLFPAPAHATHHCATPVVQDDYGIVYTVWLGCESGVHQPDTYAVYVVCWLSPTC
jgi:hypothetical protein